jgi:hypothetical protein
LPRLFYGIFLGVAVLMLVIATITSISTGFTLANQQRARGHVTALVTRTDADGDLFYYPVVRFVLPDGSRQTVQTTEGSWPPAYQVDESVTIVYDPEHSDQARIDSFAGALSLWIVPLVTGILGVAFLLATLLAHRMFST